MDIQNKKIRIALASVIGVAIIGLVAFFSIQFFALRNDAGTQSSLSSGQSMNTGVGLTAEEIQQQLKELDDIRQKTAEQNGQFSSGPTEDDIKSQLRQLDAMRANQQPPTDEEIKAQLDQLNALRISQQ